LGYLLQRLLIWVLAGGVAVAATLIPAISFGGAATGSAPFRADDPLLREPKPLPVGKLRTNKLSDAGDFLRETLFEPGEKQSRTDPTPSLDTNTLDEVPDGAWYTNRHYFHPMTDDELFRGVDGTKPPSTEEPWDIYQAKLEGISPGFRIRDARGEKYVIKFDPLDFNEMATGADVVGARFFHALGYNVPDNYPVRFRRDQLHLGENIRFERQGRKAIMQQADLDYLLSKVPQYPDGTYRALASRLISGDILGPFQFYGTRPDDPNDLIPHERRRVLRGYYVFAAWLDHTDSRAINTLDTIQQVDGVRAVRHYLIDFGATLGSDSLVPKEVWHGHTYTLDFEWGLKELGTLGFHSAEWERMHYQTLPSVGRFTAETFEPGAWKPSYPNPAFDNRTIEDCFWAAKQVMAFTDGQIRAMVKAGAYADPAAAERIAKVLIDRRDKIGRYYLSKILPLDRFEVRNGKLLFRDVGDAGNYAVTWSTFDNRSQTRKPIAGAFGFRVPQAGSEYLAAEITGGKYKATVYLREGAVVGVER
jgi:hypothetical protein